MIADVELKPLTREQYNKNLVLGISNGSLKLVDSLSDHYSLPSDTTIYDRVFDRNYITKWNADTLLTLFKDVVDEIEFSLNIHNEGVILNYTPIDAISIMILHLSRYKVLSAEDQARADSIIEAALGLCPRFSFFVQVFPNAKERTISTDLLANLKAGVYNRYYERLQCVVIQVSECFTTDESRSDFVVKVIDVLKKTY